MSDERQYSRDEDELEDEQPPGTTKIGALSGLIIDVLKWVAIIFAAIIFVVVVVVITLRLMGRTAKSSTTRLPLQSEYEDVGAELLEWYGQLGDIRGTTADEVQKTYIVTPYIGFETENEAVLQELINRQIQLKEAIAIYFSSRTVAQLAGVENRHKVKRELREEINRIMTNNIRDVAFDRYEFIEF